MSDFGFDAYALDDLDTSGQTHPLEIARDLIASGRPRAALDLLSDHHDQLVDDPEYLLLCSAAWWADGDTLRAQQALQGAARLAPGDPRPLQGLGELLAERGEHDKAELLLAKARALEVQAIENELSMDEMGTEAADDLIAFAERRDRKTQGALTPRQVLLGIVVLLGLALLIAAIVLVTSPRKAASPPRGAAPSTTSNIAEEPAAWDVAEEPEEPPTVAAAEEVEELLPVEVAEPPVVAVLDRPTKVDPPKPETARVEAASPVPSRKAAPTRRRTAPVTSASRKDAEPQLVQPPNDTVVQTELASMDPQQLTTRADKLDQEGHSALAASYYRRALEIDPDYAPALVGMGQSILRAKKYSDAMKNATRALQLARGVDARPGLEAVAIYQMGRVHYERGERDAARRLFRQSISLPGAPPEAWFYLGEALSSDNSPAARQAYEKYLELVPKGPLSDRARRAIR